MEVKQVVTPMMRQYLEIKKNYKDSILFFRLGDFYEMFFDEAIEVSRLLSLTLTKRNGVPMCGIPYHAYKVYVARLLRAGKKIAICEQVSTPLPGELTKREVTEVISPGIATEEDFLENYRDNYLLAIYFSNKKTEGYKGYNYYASIAYIDVSSGSFYATSFLSEDAEKELFKEIGRILPSEVLIQQSLKLNETIIKKLELTCPNILTTSFPDFLFEENKAFEHICNLFETETLKSFGLEKTSPEVIPIGFIIEYLSNTSKKLLNHIGKIQIIRECDYVSIDYSTRKNLELINNLNDNSSTYTLLEVVNHTKTSMGHRLLRHRIQEPIYSKEELNDRLDLIDSLIKNTNAFNLIRSSLNSIGDMQRLIGRIAMEKANGKDLITFSKALKEVINIIKIKEEHSLQFLKLTQNETNRIKEIYSLIISSINETPPISILEGNLIKKGFNEEVDRLSLIHENAQEILEQYVSSERKKTGIQTLKIKYNKLMGYFLEVSKSNLNKAPSYFIKKRSISNSDRYTTEELEKIVEEIIGAQEALINLENSIFIKVRNEVKEEHKMLQKVAEEVSELDVFQSLANTAKINNWTRPKFNNDGSLIIINGRHPVVEAHLKSGEFVPNSLSLSSETQDGSFKLKEKFPSFAIITGPNMAGKSTFLRQTALIVLLSQIGSYVPADSVSLYPVDKIFCRVGASDNLARGESTFLVEMTETSYILHTATTKSLVIMDEVGRGTSTEDGLSIAQACSEYLLNKIKCKTLFATHYKELTELESPNLQNLKLDIMEYNGKIVFLKKVVEGVSKSSYGLHVASLAGLPKEVLERAKNLLHFRNTFYSKQRKIEEDHNDGKEEKKDYTPSLFGEEISIINDILSQDLNNITPLIALQKISEWQSKLM